MSRSHICWLSVLAAIVLAILLPTRAVHASSTTMHLAEPGETVTIYDVSPAWYAHAPQNATEKMAQQDRFVQAPPANKQLIQQVQADAQLTAHFDLQATWQHRPAVYLLQAKYGQSVVIVMPTKASTLDIWPKELITTPLPQQPHHHLHHPNLPATGETISGLGMLGVVALLATLVVSWRQRVK